MNMWLAKLGPRMAQMLDRGRNILGVGKICWQASPWMSIVVPSLNSRASFRQYTHYCQEDHRYAGDGAEGGADRQ